MRWIWLVLLGIVVVIVYIFITRPSPPPLTPASSCVTLDFDQREGVGTFVAFSKTPTDPTVEPEVAPARVRARSSELVTWIIRNPSERDIQVGLHSVIEVGTSVNIKDEIFPSADGRVLVPANCGIAALQARLNRNLIPDPARGDSCDTSRRFYYNFYVWVSPTSLTGGKGDSIVCSWPYDPELVVERDP